MKGLLTDWGKEAVSRSGTGGLFCIQLGFKQTIFPTFWHYVDYLIYFKVIEEVQSLSVSTWIFW